MSKLRIILLLICTIPITVFAQSLRVTGVVTDAEDGSPLIGVSVVQEGTGNGVTTNLDGQYTITVPQNAVLVFSYIGMETQKIRATGNSLDVSMSTSLVLDEVVVVAYGTQKKLTITGAVSNLGNKEILKSPAASLGNAIAGKLPGVQSVQYSGLPGSDDPVIRVRGIGTLNSAEPLVLVDGVERPFTQIDPNEVEDITILKDASATAVFGVRGANGVILVTTKRGETGKVNVSFSTSAGYQQITSFIETANSYDYATTYNNAQLRDGVSPDALKFSAMALERFKNRDQLMLYPDTNWLEYMMKDGAWQYQHNVNVSGGSERAQYFISVGMFDQDGLFETFDVPDTYNFKYRRYNYRANIDLKLSKHDKLSISVGGRNENRTHIGGSESDMFGALQSALPMAGYGLDEEERFILSDPSLMGINGGNGVSQYYRRGYKKMTTNVLNLDLAYKLDLDFITKGLYFNIKGAYNSEYTQDKGKSAWATGTHMAQLDPEGGVDENGLQKYIITRGKNNINWPLEYSESIWDTRDWYAEASFGYARKFGLHNVSGLALYNQSKKYYPSQFTDIPTGYVGFVGRVTYDYDSRYLFDFNIGYNGSENFAPGKRYGTFPSGSIGWVASNEKFWEPIQEIVSFLKVRASYGIVGNDAMGGRRFMYLPAAFEYFNGTPIRNNQPGTALFGLTGGNWRPGARETAQGNEDLTWETAAKQNYGIDMKLFKNKLSITADLFFEDRKDILVDNATMLSSIYGMGTTPLNMGRVKNHGYEFVVKWEDQAGSFWYSIAPSFSYAHNEVIEMLELPQDFAYQYKTGLPVGQPFGLEFFEFYNPGETEKRYESIYGKPMPTQPGQDKLGAGDCIYVDLSGDGKIDNEDFHAMGYTDVPEYTGSVNLQFGYKGFDFSMLLVGATNVSRRLYNFYRPAFGSMQNSTLVEWVRENSWTPETAETATLPRITFANHENNQYDSKIWMVDASYVRLKNAEIGYTFSKIPGIPQIGSVRIYANGYNLLTFTDYKANDPEAQGTGGGSMKYPLTRTYNFGLKVNF